MSTHEQRERWFATFVAALGAADDYVHDAETQDDIAVYYDCDGAPIEVGTMRRYLLIERSNNDDDQRWFYDSIPELQEHVATTAEAGPGWWVHYLADLETGKQLVYSLYAVIEVPSDDTEVVDA